MTSAASTVTSFVGSEVALSRIKPSQLSEADGISMALLEYGGVSKADTAQSLAFIVENENSVGWEKDLNLSIHNVIKLAGEPLDVVAELEPLPDEYIVSDATLEESALGVTEPVKLQVSKLQAPIDTQVTKLESQQIQPEQEPVVQKPVQQKLAEPKTIWITNESIAQSRKSDNLKNRAFKNVALKNKHTKKRLQQK